MRNLTYVDGRITYAASSNGRLISDTSGSTRLYSNVRSITVHRDFEGFAFMNTVDIIESPSVTQ